MLKQGMSGDNEAHWFINDDQRLRILRGVFSAFYADIKADIIFDSNRRWCAQISLILQLFPTAYVLCCVRNPVAVVDSVECLFQKHPLRLSTIIGLQPNTTVFERVSMLMNPTTGVIGYSLNATKEAFYGPHADRLLLVNYDDLARTPAFVLGEIHDKLQLPSFAYNYEDIQDIPGASIFDESIGTPGLHSLKKRVVFEPRMSILPPEIYNSLPKPFWIKDLKTDA